MSRKEIEDFEELQIDESELELILKPQSIRFNFPTIGITKNVAFFNKYAIDIIPPRIRWFTTSEYVIGLPAAPNDKDGYLTRKVWNEVVAHLPVTLRKDKKISNGHYKLYKYKNGFAFKRYEPLKVEE